MESCLISNEILCNTKWNNMKYLVEYPMEYPMEPHEMSDGTHGVSYMNPGNTL